MFTVGCSNGRIVDIPEFLLAPCLLRAYTALHGSIKSSSPWTKELYRQQPLNVVFTGHFCLGWWSNFVGFESGQKQSVKLLQNMVYNTIQHSPTPLPHSHILDIYCTFSLGRGGGGVREKIEGQQYTSGRKYQPRVNVSPVHKIC